MSRPPSKPSASQPEVDAPKLARELEEWALVREKVLTRLDVRGARRARALANLLRSTVSRLGGYAGESQSGAEAVRSSLVDLVREARALLSRIAPLTDDEMPLPSAQKPPAGDASAAGAMPAPTRGSGVATPSHDEPPAPLNVLVVDDDPVVRSLIVRRLSAIAQVDSVGSVADALRLLEHDTYDVVVADLELGGESGAELLARVAREHPLTRRILFTGTPEALQESLRMVCHELLLKSGGVSQLLEAVAPELSHVTPASFDDSAPPLPASGEHVRIDGQAGEQPVSKRR